MQTVECIIGCTAEFTTLYNGQLLLLRLLYITITTKIDALFMMSFLFSSEAFNSGIPSISGALNSGHPCIYPILGFCENNFQIVCSYLKR